MADKISRLELAVHLFDDINFQNGYPYTEYKENYTIDNEDLMTRTYINRIKEISKDPNAYLLFVSHTPISRGILHPNVKEVYMEVIENMPDRHMALDCSLQSTHLNNIISQITGDAQISAWGEYTSGCVLYDLLTLKQTLGRQLDYESSFRELCPEQGIDFSHPRPWEKPDTAKIRQYQNNIKRTTQYFLGEIEHPM